MNEIIFFGCWGDYQNKVNEVLGSLNYYITNNSVSNVIIAGDNYYIKKDGKLKEYREKEAYDIIKLLFKRTAGVTTHVLAGNHEYDKLSKKKLKVDVEDKCIILHEELEAFRELPPTIHFSTIYSDDDKSFLLNETTLYLFLDSSMYEYNDDEANCYTGSLPELRHSQVEKMARIIDSNQGKFSKIVCCAHHPLFIFRIKGQELSAPAPNYMMLNSLLEFLPPDVPEIDYLCADFHIYQQSVLDIKRSDDRNLHVNQYIVGTGGTNLDDFFKPTMNSVPGFEFLTHEFLTSNITEYYKSNLPSLLGGLNVEIENDTIRITTNNGYHVEATHLTSKKDYGYLVISPTYRFVPLGLVGGKRTKRKSKRRRKSKRKFI